LLAIVTVPPFLCGGIDHREYFKARSRKISKSFRGVPMWQQIVEIPHDLAVRRMRGAGCSQQIINLNN
jgi:hypothetical protein